MNKAPGTNKSCSASITKNTPLSALIGRPQNFKWETTL